MTARARVNPHGENWVGEICSWAAVRATLHYTNTLYNTSVGGGHYLHLRAFVNGLATNYEQVRWCEAHIFTRRYVLLWFCHRVNYCTNCSLASRHWWTSWTKSFTTSMCRGNSVPVNSSECRPLTTVCLTSDWNPRLLNSLIRSFEVTHRNNILPANRCHEVNTSIMTPIFRALTNLRINFEVRLIASAGWLSYMSSRTLYTRYDTTAQTTACYRWNHCEIILQMKLERRDKFNKMFWSRWTNRVIFQ